MPHPLEKRISAIRRRLRWLMLAYALAWVLGTVVATLAILSLADYAIHFQDRGIRWILSLTVAGVAGWFAYRYLWTAWRTRFRDIDVAMRIERRFPQLADQLSSTLQFLSQREDDPLAGSAAMRREVVNRTVTAVGPLNLADALQTWPVIRAVLVAAVVCLVAAGLYLVDPPSASTALTRLAQPWSDTAWPKSNHLGFSKFPQRVALGQRFEVELIDVQGASLPDEVRIHYRFAGDGHEAVESVETMQRVRDVLVASIDSVSRPFAYRAEGGDDNTMTWHELEVIEPPTTQELSLRLHYPAYTAWLPEVSEPSIRALMGTRIEVAAKTTKPLRSASVKMENTPDVSAVLGGEGYEFKIAADAAEPFVVQKSGTYAFDLEDREGFHGGSTARYELRAVEDHAPSVMLDQPTADIFVTAEASVPLRAQAKDDLVIASMAIRWSRSDKSDEPEREIVLFQGPELSAITPGPRPADSGRGDSRVVEHRWELGELKLPPGARVTLYATASDYRPGVGQSHARRLTIITPEELQDRLAERQTFIINELNRQLGLERESRAQVSELLIQLEQVGKLSKEDLDRLQQAELTQRQVERGLTSKTDGIPASIQNLLTDLENNKVRESDIAKRMQGLQKGLQDLNRDHLPAIARDLTTSFKDAQTKLSDGTPPTPGKKADDTPLASAGRHQDEVISSLETMLKELSEWDNYRRFHRDLSQLRRDQEALEKDTAQLGAKTLTNDLKDLEPQQKADLKKLAQRQFDLSRDFDKIQQRMEEAGPNLRDSDPVAADTLSDAAHQAREQAMSGQMRQAGQNVEKNQVGQAVAQQQQTLKNLDELLDTLANRREHELDRLVKKLREAEKQLEQFRERQEGLHKKMQEAAAKQDEAEKRRELERLSREQRKLQEEVERFARTLKRLQAEQASRTAAKSGSRMGQAGQQGEQGNAGGASDQAAAAKKDLDDAQQELARARQKAEQDLANEQMAQLSDNLKSIHDQQTKLLQETRSYETRRQQQGNLTRAEAASVGDLARQQQSLKNEIDELARKLAAMEVIELPLMDTASKMSKAGEQLAQRETGAVTQKAEQRALDRIGQIMESLKQDPTDPQQQEPQPEKNEGGGGAGSPQGGERAPSISELKLLKLLQDDINHRTAELEEAFRQTQTLTPEQQQEYAELGAEQGKLADLLLNMTEPAEAPVSGEDLEKLLDKSLQQKEPMPAKEPAEPKP